MLVTIGDLVEDVGVRLRTEINRASDTESRITRRRGGSAANTAVAAAAAGYPTRFIGQVGVDRLGASLITEMADAGIDTQFIGQAGETSSIVVLVEPDGERTFLTDRRTSRDLTSPQRCWLDDATALHVPFYSLAEEPLAATTQTVLGWAATDGLVISIDVSSVAVLETFGPSAVLDLLADLKPDLIFANGVEAAVLRLDDPGRRAELGSTIVVKHGPDPVSITRPNTEPLWVPVPPVADVADTTGAGDAFAGGVLSALLRERTQDWSGEQLAAAARAGHRSAAKVLARQT